MIVMIGRISPNITPKNRDRRRIVKYMYLIVI